MVKPAFADIDVQVWLHRGRLGTTERSVCVFHASTGLGSAIAEALQELETDKRPAKRTLTFNTHAKAQHIEQMQLQLLDATEALRVMHIAATKQRATIRLTPLGLDVLRQGLSTWLAGGEDFGISPRHAQLRRKELGVLDLDSLELWFWGPGYVGP